jgi:hypothetical protein
VYKCIPASIILYRYYQSVTWVPIDIWFTSTRSKDKINYYNSLKSSFCAGYNEKRFHFIHKPLHIFVNIKSFKFPSVGQQIFSQLGLKCLWLYFLLLEVFFICFNVYKLPSMVSLALLQLIFSSILPLLSVWSQPHKLGTLAWHLLCTFMSHAVIDYSSIKKKTLIFIE